MIFVTAQERFGRHLSGDSGLFYATKWMHVLRGSSRAEDQKTWFRSWGKKQISEIRSMVDKFKHRVCFLFVRVGKE